MTEQPEDKEAPGVDALPFASIHRHGFVRVAAATPMGSAGDVAFNVDQAVALARRAADAHVDLCVFPELNLSSYAVDDLHLQDAFLDAVEQGLARLLKETADLNPVLALGLPVRRNGRVYNCAIAVSRGRILGIVPKSFLPNYREYYEKRWFAPITARSPARSARRSRTCSRVAGCAAWSRRRHSSSASTWAPSTSSSRSRRRRRWRADCSASGAPVTGSTKPAPASFFPSSAAICWRARP